MRAAAAAMQAGPRASHAWLIVAMLLLLTISAHATPPPPLAAGDARDQSGAPLSTHPHETIRELRERLLAEAEGMPRHARGTACGAALTSVISEFSEGPTHRTGLNCVWTFDPSLPGYETRPVRSTNLRLPVFDLTSASGAMTGLLTVYDGVLFTDPVLATFAGKRLPGDAESRWHVQLDGKRKYLVQLITGSEAGPGLTGHAYTSFCPDMTDVTATSPASLVYEPYAACAWRYIDTEPDYERLALTFDNFQLPNDAAVTAYDGFSLALATPIQVFMGARGALHTDALWTALSSGGSMLWQFTSTFSAVTPGDDSFDFRNYRAPFCAGLSTLPSAVFVGSFEDGSGAFNLHSRRANCTWLLQPGADDAGAVQFLEIAFDTVELGEGARIDVYNGTATNGTLLGTFSGTKHDFGHVPAWSASAYTSALLVHMETADERRAGFTASYYARFCSSHHSFAGPANTTKMTDRSGIEPYGAYSDCWFTLSPEGGAAALELHVDEWNLGEGSSLTIYDGDAVGAGEVGVYGPDDLALGSTVKTRGESVLAHFVAGEAVGAGFALRGLPAPLCGDHTMHATTATFDDGSGPWHPHARNITCTWTISPEAGVEPLGTVLVFDEFDIAYNATVMVYAGTNAAAPLVATFEGSLDGAPGHRVDVSGGELFIVFHVPSNASIPRGAGWRATYSFHFCSGHVETLTDAWGAVHDGSGPWLPYGAAHEDIHTCTWSIQPDVAAFGPYAALVLYVDVFTVGTGAVDLTIFDGDDMTAEANRGVWRESKDEGEGYSGLYVRHLTQPSATVRWRTFRASETPAGFRVAYTTISCMGKQDGLLGFVGGRLFDGSPPTVSYSAGSRCSFTAQTNGSAEAQGLRFDLSFLQLHNDADSLTLYNGIVYSEDEHASPTEGLSVAHVLTRSAPGDIDAVNNVTLAVQLRTSASEVTIEFVSEPITHGPYYACDPYCPPALRSGGARCGDGSQATLNDTAPCDGLGLDCWPCAYDADESLYHTSAAGGGFELNRYTTLLCSEEVAVLSNDTGTLSDFSGPTHDMSENTLCRWLIQPERALAIELTIAATPLPLDATVTVYRGGTVHDDVARVFEWDELDGGGDPDAEDIVLAVLAEEVLIVLDAPNDGPGQLEVAYRTIFCNDTRTMYDAVGAFDDGTNFGSPLMEANAHCTFAIEADVDRDVPVRLFFDRASLGTSTVRVYDGRNDTADLLRVFSGGDKLEPAGSGPLPFWTVTSTSRKMALVLDTGEERARGFEAQYFPVWCASLVQLTEPNGTFTDGSGDEDHMRYASCSWLLTPGAQFEHVTVHVTSMELGEGAVLSFFDGPTSDSPLLTTMHGSKEDHPTTSWDVSSSTGDLLVHLEGTTAHTDAGFSMYYQGAPFCEGRTTLVGTEGSFTDGSGSSLQMANRTCEWVVAPDLGVNADGVEMLSISVVLEEAELGNNTVLVYGAASAPVNETLVPVADFTGNRVAESDADDWRVTVRKANVSEVLVQLDMGKRRAQGFRARFFVSFCDGAVNRTSDTGTFSDGSGPFSVGRSSDCAWVIEPSSPGDYVEIEFTSFSMLGEADRVLVYDGDTTEARVLFTLEGERGAGDDASAWTVQGTGSALLVRLITEDVGSVASQGFSASWRHVRYCGGLVEAQSAQPFLSFRDGSPPDREHTPFANCTWRFDPPGQPTQLWLEFVRFDTVEHSGNVTVTGDDAFRRVFSGTKADTDPAWLWAFNTTQTRDLDVHFLSTAATGLGFRGTMYATYCNRSTELTDAWGMVVDGSGPDANYGPFSLCEWTLAPHGASGVTVMVDTLELKADTNLIFYDGPSAASPQLARFTGPLEGTRRSEGRTLFATGPIVFVSFDSGTVLNSAPGFDFSWTPTTCSHSEVSNYRGSVTDGSAPGEPYSRNMDCQWRVCPTSSASSTAQVMLTFDSFDMIDAADNVTIYDGLSVEAPVLGMFNQNDHPVVGAMVAQSTQSCVLVRMQTGLVEEGPFYACDLRCPYVMRTAARCVNGSTDAVIDTETACDGVGGGVECWLCDYSFDAAVRNIGHVGGFELAYEPVFCAGSRTVTGAAGRFHDGSGPEPYVANADCSWVVQPGGLVVTARMDVQLSQGGAVRVYDGPTAAFPLLAEFLGPLTYVGADNAAIRTTGATMLVHFEAGPQSAPGGFEMLYGTRFCEGTAVVSASQGSFGDGSGAEQDHSADSDCVWQVQRQADAAQLTVFFDEFDLVPGQGFVRAYAGTNTTKAAQLLRTFTGVRTSGGDDLTPAWMVSTREDTMSLHFETTGNHSAGWKATYFSEWCGVDGEVVLTDASGVFTDGSGGEQHQPFASCAWIISPSVVALEGFLEVRIDEMDLAADGVLRVYEGTSTLSPLLASFSGAKTAADVLSVRTLSRNVLVTFTSSRDVGDGFSITYSSLGYCRGTLALTDVEATVEDGSGSEPISLNSDCLFHIDPLQPEGMAVDYIDITITQLALESDASVDVYAGASATGAVQATFEGTRAPGQPNDVWSVRVTGTDAVVRLRTGNAASETMVFTYTAHLVPVPKCSGRTVITKQSGELDDGSGALDLFSPYSECEWVIELLGDVIANTLVFEQVDLADATLVVYEGNTEGGRVLDTFTGSKPPGVEWKITVFTSVLLHFTTQQEQDQGFFMSWTTSYCTGRARHTQPWYHFDDGSGDTANYGKNSECEWLIQPDDAHGAVVLLLDQYDLAEGSTLRVYDGDSRFQAPLLAEFTGTRTTTGIEERYTVRSSQPTLLLRLEAGELEAAGFAVTYYASTCGRSTLSASNGTIWDGSTPDRAYPRSIHCTWLVDPFPATPVGMSLFLEYLLVDSSDQITIYEADGPYDENIVFRDFGANGLATSRRRSLQTLGPFLFVEFKSKNIVPDTFCSLTCPPGLRLHTLCNDGTTRADTESPTACVANNGIQCYECDFAGTQVFTNLLGINGGFNITYQSIFCRPVTKIFGVGSLLSDGSGSQSDIIPATCLWLLEPDSEVDRVDMRFTNVLMPPGASLTAYDGKDTSAPMLVRFTSQGAEVAPNAVVSRMSHGHGALPAPPDGAVVRALAQAGNTSMPTQVDEIQIGSTAANVALLFESTVEAPGGFSMGFSGQYCVGTTVFTRLAATFTDGSNENDYREGADCFWLLQPERVNNTAGNITIVLEYELAATAGIISVYDGATTDAPLLSSFVGGSAQPFELSTTGEQALVHFEAGGETGRGFVARYAFVPEIPPPQPIVRTNSPDPSWWVIVVPVVGGVIIFWFVLRRKKRKIHSLKEYLHLRHAKINMGVQTLPVRFADGDDEERGLLNDDRGGRRRRRRSKKSGGHSVSVGTGPAELERRAKSKAPSTSTERLFYWICEAHKTMIGEDDPRYLPKPWRDLYDEAFDHGVKMIKWPDYVYFRLVGKHSAEIDLSEKPRQDVYKKVNELNDALEKQFYWIVLSFKLRRHKLDAAADVEWQTLYYDAVNTGIPEEKWPVWVSNQLEMIYREEQMRKEDERWWELYQEEQNALDLHETYLVEKEHLTAKLRRDQVQSELERERNSIQQREMEELDTYNAHNARDAHDAGDYSMPERPREREWVDEDGGLHDDRAIEMVRYEVPHYVHSDEPMHGDGAWDASANAWDEQPRQPHEPYESHNEQQHYGGDWESYGDGGGFDNTSAQW